MRLPLIWRVPLAVSVLMFAVSAVITERVLDRLGSIQETYLQSIANSYLDGITASISPSVLREDSWEIFDALERLRPVNTDIVPSQTIVTTPGSIVLAATDPETYPSLQQLPAAFVTRFPDDAIQIDEEDERAFLARKIVYQGKEIGRIYTIFDASVLLRERRDVLATLILTNTALAALLTLVGFMTVRRMIQPMQTLESHMLEAAEGHARRIGIPDGARVRPEAGRLFAAYNSLLDADDERRKLSRKLAEEEKLASLGRLSSVMAHEINNPLGGLLNAVDTLRRHGEKREVREASLSLLQRGLQGIGEVVRVALATYRPDRRERPLSRGDFEDMRLLLTPELRRRSQRLELSLPDGELASPCAAGPVRQAIINLLLNASAASPEGAPLGLTILSDGDVLSIHVEDRGPGMPEEAAALLTGSVRDPLPAGTGLGLWVVRQIAEEVDASVGVENRSGGGSVVVMRIARRPAGAQHHAA